MLVDGAVEVTQVLSLVSDDFAGPVMFQPVVIAAADIPPFEVAPTDGLDALWSGEAVSFPIGAMLALGPFLNAKTLVQSILRLRRSEENQLQCGSYEVTAAAEEGFYFLIDTAPDLYDALVNPQSFPHRDSILSAAFAQGLSILRDRFSANGSDWKDYENLRLLYGMLRERDIATWEEDDFRPNQVAAVFHPHRIDMAHDDTSD